MIIRTYTVWMPVRCWDGKETILHSEMGSDLAHAQQIADESKKRIADWHEANRVVRYAQFIVTYVEVQPKEMISHD